MEPTPKGVQAVEDIGIDGWIELAQTAEVAMMNG